MRNKVKHLGLEQDLRKIVGVRFFAALRMTSFIYSYQKTIYVKVSQVEYCYNRQYSNGLSIMGKGTYSITIISSSPKQYILHPPWTSKAATGTFVILINFLDVVCPVRYE